MRKPNLSAQDVRSQFDYDPETGELLRKNLRARNQRIESGSSNAEGYLVVGINGGHQLAHRLIWLWVHGEWAPKQIEHINGDKADNRLANLRLRSPAVKEPLTPERLREVLRYEKETGKFYWKVATRGARKGDEAGCVRKIGYRAITVDSSMFYAHRLAWFWEYGKWPNSHVDHVNGDRDDNRIENLRDVSPSRNSHNSTKLGPNNTTGFRGVARYMDKYIAQIMVDGKRMAIGMYDTPEEASVAYKAKYVELFGSEPPNCNERVYPRKSRSKRGE